VVVQRKRPRLPKSIVEVCSCARVLVCLPPANIGCTWGCQIVCPPCTVRACPDDLTSRDQSGGLPVPTSRVQDVLPWCRVTPRSTPSPSSPIRLRMLPQGMHVSDGAQISGRQGHMEVGQGTVLGERKQDQDAGRQLRGLGTGFGGKVRRQTGTAPSSLQSGRIIRCKHRSQTTASFHMLVKPV